MSRENDYYWAFESHKCLGPAGEGCMDSAKMNFESERRPKLGSGRDVTNERKRQRWFVSVLFDNRVAMWKYILRTGLISLVPSVVIVRILAVFDQC